MTSKENYNEPIYENLKYFKGLELVYRHPCLHLRTENKECGNCKYGLNNNCVIHNEYLKIKKDLEELKTIKEFIMDHIDLYDNGMCLDEYIYNSEPVAKIIRRWEDEESNN